MLGVIEILFRHQLAAYTRRVWRTSGIKFLANAQQKLFVTQAIALGVFGIAVALIIGVVDR